MLDETVTTTLAEKIQRQEHFINELQKELRQARIASIETMLGPLRLRQAVLLYVGQDTDNFTQQLTQEFGREVAGAVLASLFVLDNAPVSVNTREALRTACNHGMNRW
jgi:hypothetical protein